MLPAPDPHSNATPHAEQASDGVVVPFDRAARHRPVRLRIWGGQPEDGATELPDVTGMTNAEAAEAYARPEYALYQYDPAQRTQEAT